MGFFKGLGRITGQTFVSFFRMLFVAFVTGLALVYFVDGLTNTKNGTDNIVLIASVFTFFCTFVPLFVEMLLTERRKDKRAAKKFKEKMNTTNVKTTKTIAK